MMDNERTMDRPVEISVVCPVTRFASDLAGVHREFRAVLARLGKSAEFLYVFDGPQPTAEQSLSTVDENEFPLRVLHLAKGFGEATALQVGFDNARGRLILTIPDRPQIDASAIAEVLARLDQGDEVVVTRREPRSDALLNRLQARAFHGLVRGFVGQDFHDMTCGLRGFTAEAARRLELYGDQHRFIPVIAVRCGYKVTEIPGAQHAENRRLRVYGPGVYLRRVIDILNIYFLTRFTRKPLRFFGLIGSAIGFAGFVISASLALKKIFFGAALSNRPLLLLGVLLLVLGVQVISIGLVGEIIIFLSTRREIPVVIEYREGGDEESGRGDEPDVAGASAGAGQGVGTSPTRMT